MKVAKKKSLLWRIARDAERDAIERAIAEYGSRVRAAASLGISTMTLRTKLATK
jgi:DNA-binding NtrC family response regulator